MLKLESWVGGPFGFLGPSGGDLDVPGLEFAPVASENIEQ